MCNTTGQDHAGHAGWNGVPGSLKEKTQHSLSKSRHHPELYSLQSTQAHQRHWVSVCLFMGHIYRTSYLVYLLYVHSMNNNILLNYFFVGWHNYHTVWKHVLFMASTNTAAYKHDVYVYVLLDTEYHDSCNIHISWMASEAGCAITIKSFVSLKGKLGTTACCILWYGLLMYEHIIV